MAEGSQVIPLDGADFEQGKVPAGWGHGHGEARSSPATRPKARPIIACQRKKGPTCAAPALAVEPGVEYFVSYWLKNSDEPWAYINFTSDEREPSFRNTYPGIAFNTRDQWKQVGFYFCMPAQCNTIQLLIAPREDGADGQFICIDDIRLRTATEAEIKAAYAAERAQLPPYDVASRPGDGKNLALSRSPSGKAGRAFLASHS